MKVADLIDKLEDMPPDADVWVLSAETQTQEATWVHVTDGNRVVIMSAAFREVPS